MDFKIKDTTLKKYKGKDAKVVIPEGITKIDESAFYGCTGLTSITIPDSVTSIGGSAFAGCTGLTSITIPDSITNIGTNAFLSCTGLKKVHINNLKAWFKISFGFFLQIRFGMPTIYI